jgi:hypothetical protein
MASDDDFTDLLAHEVTASAGLVGAADADGMVPAVRLVFHHGHDDDAAARVRHSERFVAPGALPALIADLRSLQALLDADEAASAVVAGWNAGPGVFKDAVRSLSNLERGLLELPITSFVLGSMAACLDEIAAGNPPMLGVLADTLDDALGGPLGDEIRRIAEAVGQITPRPPA